MSMSNEMKELRKILEDYIEDARRTQRDHIRARGRDPEKLDPIPVEGAVYGPPEPPTMREQIQEYIREVVSKQAESQDLGSFVEEDDFEEEDPELLNLSGFEINDYDLEEEIPIADAAPPQESAEGSQEPPPEAEAEAVNTPQ